MKYQRRSMKMNLSSAVKLLIIFTFLDSVLLHRSRGPPKCDMQQFIPEFAKKVGCTDLKVQFGNHTLVCGEKLDVLTVSKTPTITYDLTGQCKYATIIEITPDDLAFSPYVYYLVHNIPVECLKDGFQGKNEDIPLIGSDVGDYGAKYLFSKNVVSGPTGFPHYIYFVYCQCRHIPKSQIKVYFPRPERNYFDIRKYTKDKQLGNPRAGIYHLYQPTGINLPVIVQKPTVV